MLRTVASSPSEVVCTAQFLHVFAVAGRGGGAAWALAGVRVVTVTVVEELFVASEV